uniref:Uncharacterized protein n=1 Tax=Meloidogyne floridensis TaxID=298350 RepID=A0A915NUR4_9BILA
MTSQDDQQHVNWLRTLNWTRFAVIALVYLIMYELFEPHSSVLPHQSLSHPNKKTARRGFGIARRDYWVGQNKQGS